MTVPVIDPVAIVPVSHGTIEDGVVRSPNIQGILGRRGLDCGQSLGRLDKGADERLEEAKRNKNGCDLHGERQRTNNL